ncbi:hypothetical protein [Embleya hyalina]|uniref:SMI1/KNR4 family protein n=1 Tax=Embleya hyalina TaxID=516124 RepID=A0A401YR53_9ACTN|nr:hypothetical protein [Embleya hyalina]GCD97088.1 hypothetical protein EHYA_04775 [Embleya hyalina]
MNSDSLDPHWVRNWTVDITAHLRSVLSVFDGDDPYPPGRNEIVLTGSDQRDFEAMRVHSAIPQDLITFYSVTNEVVMSAFANAFFINPPSHVIRQFSEEPVVLADGNLGTIFAGNGGGILYAMGSDNKVYRSHTAALNGGFTPIATGLRDFLEQLRDAVALYALVQDPGRW